MRASRLAGSALAWILGAAATGCTTYDHSPEADGASDIASTAAALTAADTDGDGIADTADNCPTIANADQARAGSFGPGDACRLSLSASSGLLGRFARFQSHKELVTLVVPFTLNFGPDLMNVAASGAGPTRPHFSLLSQRLGVASQNALFPGDTDTLKPGETLTLGLGAASVLGDAQASAVWLRLDGKGLVRVSFLRGTSVVASETRAQNGTSFQRFALPDGAGFSAVRVSVDSGRAALRGPGEVVVFALGDATFTCPAGQRAVSGQCEDIDECAGLNHACDPLVTCANTPGSYECGPCPAGFSGTGNTSCNDIDECATGSAQCSPLVACSNTVGSYACGACPSGYAGDGHTCSDIDECADGSAHCDTLTACTNRAGGYDCGHCPIGYTGDGALGCVDVDECANNQCDHLTTCSNSPGSFACSPCPAGYRGTGETSCIDIDECADGSATCSSLVTCANSAGGYACGACPHGYEGDGHTCTDVNECARGLDDCSALAGCNNTEGGYECGACPGGYAGDGHVCSDIDECAAAPCDARVSCSNTSGSYLCGACPQGFTGDGYAGCVDVDECAFDNGGCADTDGCTNLDGTFRCEICPGVPGQPTSCGVGACARSGVTSCTRGVFGDSCAAGVPAVHVDLTCNGIDDDCDGSADEEYVASVTSCGSGACERAGLLACENGAVRDSCTLPSAGSLCDDGNVCNGRDACNAAGACVAIVADSAMCCPTGVAIDSLAGTGVDLSLSSDFAADVVPLYSGSYASQIGSVAGIFLPLAVGVVHGRVLSPSGAVVSCATISQLSILAVGSTLSRGNGQFAMLLNGGGNATLRISAPGFTAVNVAVRPKENRVLELGDVRLRP